MTARFIVHTDFNPNFADYKTSSAFKKTAEKYHAGIIEKKIGYALIIEKNFSLDVHELKVNLYPNNVVRIFQMHS